MVAVNALCSRTIMLEKGTTKAEGPTSEVTALYYAEAVGKIDTGGDLTAVARTGTGKARFTSLSLQPLGVNGEPVEVPYPGCDLRVEFEIQCYAPIVETIAAAIIYDQNGFRVIDANTGQKDKYLTLGPGQKAKISLLLREVLLRPGQYLVGLWLGRHNMEVTDHVEYAAQFTVMAPKEYSEHPITYPGIYVCRFEEDISIA